MIRNVLIFGSIAGVIVSAFMATSMAIMGCASTDGGNMTLSMVIGFASMFAAFSFVFVGVKNYRDKKNGGTLSFGKGLLLGLLIAFIGSTFYVITWAIQFHYFLPDFMDKYSAIQIKELSKQLTADITAAPSLKDSLEAAFNTNVIKINETKVNYVNSPLYFAAATYTEILPVGIIASLISALILMRKKPRIATA